MLMALTGNPVEASTCLERHADRMAATEAVFERATYLKVRALVSLASGDLEAARQDRPRRCRLTRWGSTARLPWRSRLAPPSGWATGRARSVLSAMQVFRGQWMAAERLTAEAGLAALDKRVEHTAESYRDAIEAWRALACTLDLALCELDLVLLLGPEHPDATAAKEARDIFTYLGATPFLERLNRAEGSEP